MQINMPRRSVAYAPRDMYAMATITQHRNITPTGSLSEVVGLRSMATERLTSTQSKHVAALALESYCGRHFSALL